MLCINFFFSISVKKKTHNAYWERKESKEEKEEDKKVKQKKE